ncbi:hypothetical protein C2845_PM04G17840 [Panicum miliaceum]|uniref:Uncharacterized protein n=1 Tax=Panicum miliaceum TaxID=4540 RepID=A0A3L6QNZ1_PANMI|nr:hypothetical protein C2845_PM04G17840 [Panicum miliaceum]
MHSSMTSFSPLRESTAIAPFESPAMAFAASTPSAREHPASSPLAREPLASTPPAWAPATSAPPAMASFRPPSRELPASSPPASTAPAREPRLRAAGLGTHGLRAGCPQPPPAGQGSRGLRAVGHKPTGGTSERGTRNGRETGGEQLNGIEDALGQFHPFFLILTWSP